MKKGIFILILLTVLLAACSVPKQNGLLLHTSNAVVSKATEVCLDCHTKKQPGIIHSWQNSTMAAAGVGCAECHNAVEGEPDAQSHYEKTVISVIVSPKDCAKCHQAQADEFMASHHAQGGQILGSLDNYIGEVVEGLPASVSGCQQCHGSFVKVNDEGKPTSDTWPNFGIGRVNPDGSSGACSACHGRHDFSREQSRRSVDSCGKCHMGPDHPQKEVYNESKHAVAFYSHMEEMNLDSKEWVAGRDYSAAPTCATCHMSATASQKITHDTGTRRSWNISAAISTKMDEFSKKRQNMTDVCLSCHAPDYVKKFFSQYEAGIELYNEKFAKPAKEIMDKLTAAKKIDAVPFNEKIEWTYFYLWHHEGRRARNGLAMSGPDYVHWHGFYDIAERFYTELVPEAEHLLPGVTKEILARPEHLWYTGKLTDEIREANKKAFDKFYK